MAFNDHDRHRQEEILERLKRLSFNEREEIEEIERLTEINQVLINELAEKNKPIFALTTFINNQSFIMANVALVIGGTPNVGAFTLVDNKTLSPISPVSYSNQALGANSDPTLASFTLDTTNNTVSGTGLAAGSGTQVITTHADYTDPGDGSAKSLDFSVTKNYTVVASADGATFDVVFS